MMAFKSAQTAGISTTAVKLVDGGSASPYDPIRVKLKTPTGTVYVGGANVTTATGFPVTTTTEDFDVTDGSDLYAIATTSTTVQVFYNEKQ